MMTTRPVSGGSEVYEELKVTLNSLQLLIQCVVEALKLFELGTNNSFSVISRFMTMNNER